jgi:membrane-bound lytic murein transglycosylase MltF
MRKMEIGQLGRKRKDEKLKKLVFILFFVWTATALCQEIDRHAIATAEVTRYVIDWTKNVPQRYRRRALAHVESVARWSLHYDVDPLLVATIVSLESSWRSVAVGALGELGLMQVHADKAKAGYDLTDADQQIQAGTRWLRTCIEVCDGDVQRGVNMYATGHCRAPWAALEYRMGRYYRAVRMFRRPNDAPAE